ncbi:MAG: sialate O-acetylesterase [Balneolaceae bacterium]|nr:sialate O-acetylesterase [Balneolaceae bacterium]MDR9409775.1 sialate O-acetylesterase [Balneolaceae bacterium]
MYTGKRFLFLFGLCLISTSVFAQIQLPKLISDRMVLQRNQELTIWGWASPNEDVTLTFQESTFSTTADNEGIWEIKLPPQEAGGPYEMNFEGSNQVNVKNILFGDVWVASGQSNMELWMGRVRYTYENEVQNSGNSEIRQFLVPDQYDFKQTHNDFEGGEWQSAGPETILDFSAVAYFFAKELNRNYNIPIGIINAAMGGSPVESWMSEESLKEFPDAYEELQKFKDDDLIQEIQQEDQERIRKWYSELNQKDQGLNAEPKWSQPNMNDSGWDEMNLPGYWSEETSLGDQNGVVWFRKEIDVPKRMTGKPARLWMGRIVDQDSVFVNGQLVGNTGYQYPPRRYHLDSTVLKEVKNEIAIRVINSSGSGGFVPDKPYYLSVGTDTLHLTGDWKYKLGASMEPLASQTFVRWKPAGLYNRMITPLLDYSIKGVIWYQGESNTDDPGEYEKRFSTMIETWRDNWNQGDFPFLFVQLANYMETTDEPVQSNWAELRQAQLNTLKLPNTGMAVTIDVGEWNDIHPLNKKDVGHRLALQAQKIAYGEEDLAAGGPIPDRSMFRSNEVIIHFKNVVNGLTTSDGEAPKHFAISDDGENFVWAKAEIMENSIRVWNDEISNPAAVRYAWANNPESANLTNQKDLPATPFEVTKN